MPFKRQHKILFLDPGCETAVKDEKVDIILSPSLYWVKKITLPLNSLREVKTLLPSLFEETLPEGIYSYSLYKNSEDSLFYAFAYEDKKILDLIAQHSIPLANIASVRFAQSEMNTITHPVQINDTQCLYLKDGLVVLLPSAWVKESEPLDLSTLRLSRHKITLQQFAHIVDYKSLYGIITVLLVFILITLSELFITAQRAEAMAEKNRELLLKENLKPTMFENRSLLKKFEKTHETQTRLREYLAYILAVRLDRGERMSTLSLKNRSILVDFEGVDGKRRAAIESLLSAKGVPFVQKHEEMSLHLEIKL